MRQFRFFSLIGSVAVALASFTEKITDAIGSMIAFAIALVLPSPMRFAFAGDFAIEPTGKPLDLALQNDMRHEASMHRRSAARKT